MADDAVTSLQDLSALFQAHQGELNEDVRRLFQAILLELGRGEQMDYTALEKMLRKLGERTDLGRQAVRKD